MNPEPLAGRIRSPLMLGTAQFGMPYGVANRTGPPDDREVRAILAAALDGGIDGFDTAASYGNSEAVLGRALRALGVADRAMVVTKVQALTPEAHADAARAARAIRLSVDRSRERLGLECLPVVLFHREADARYLDVLDSLKTEGWLRHAGVSCEYRPGPAAQFVADGRAEALQLPANLLDHRHRRSGIFRAALDRGVAVFVRSVYLQGLLVMPEAHIPAGLCGVIPVRRRLAAIAAGAGMPPAELALRYMLSQPGVSSVVVGVETAAQIRDNLALCNRGPLSADLLAAVDAAVPELPEEWISPALWPQRD